MSEIHERGPAAGQEVMPKHPGETLGMLMSGGEWKPYPKDFPFSEIKSDMFSVPTILMTHLMQRARATNLPLAPPEEIEKRLQPGKEHIVTLMREVYEISSPGRGSGRGADAVEYQEAGREYQANMWVRANVRLCLDDDLDGNRAYVDWYDFDAVIIGQLIEQHQKQHGLKRNDAWHGPWPPGWKGNFKVDPPPHWVGTHSFESVYAAAADDARSEPVERGNVRMNVRQVMSINETTHLMHAHVLVMDPEQVAVLPQWETAQEVFDYADEVQLPFDPLFLDFTGPGGMAPAVPNWFSDADPLVLSGALVWRVGAQLAVAPYGWPMAGVPAPLSHWQSPGWFVFGLDPENEGNATHPTGDMQLFMQGTPFYGMAATCYANACAMVDEEAGPMPGFAMLPFSKDSVMKSTEGDAGLAAETLMMWGQMIWALSQKALAALSITEAVEVEFVDAPMEKRVKKRAIKRRWPIAQQVVLRAHQTRYRERNPASGAEANYSHRFWRRATVAHYPLGTRMANARPDLVTPCHRSAERNCGFCRKVPHPATLVGPDHLPVVLKTLVRRRPK